MPQAIYRYAFDPEVPAEEIEATLFLSILGAECLHGETQVRLDAAHVLDLASRTCVIDAGTTVGSAINRLFAGFVTREFGTDAFQVDRVETERAELLTA